MLGGISDLYEFDNESEDEAYSTYVGCDTGSDDQSDTEDDPVPAPVTYVCILPTVDSDSDF